MIGNYGVVTVRPAVLGDAAKLAPNLRQADLQEIQAASFRSPQEALEVGVRAGQSYAAVLPSGEIVALFGVAPTAEPKLGAVWMMASDSLLSIKTTFLRHSRKVLSALFADYSLLGNVVDARNTVHIEWLKWLGFRFLRRVPLGRNGEQFLEFVKLKEAPDSIPKCA